MLSQLSARDRAVVLLQAKRNVMLRALGDVPGHEFHGNQWTESRVTRENGEHILLEHKATGGKVGGKIESNKIVLNHVEVPEGGRGQGTGTMLVNKLREHAASQGKSIETSGHATEEGKHLFESFVKRGEAEAIKVRKPLARPRYSFALKRRVNYSEKTIYKFNKLKTLAQHPEGPVHAAADAHLHKMTLVVRAAFNLGRKAYKAGGAKAAAAAVHDALLKALPPVLLATMHAGGMAALKYPRHAALRALRPGTQSPIAMTFNVDDPNAVAWAKAHAAELAKGISDTTLQNIKDAVANALEGDGLDAAYDDILSAVGDPARADVIARTEVMTAANEGQRQGWSQAVDNGLLAPDAQVAWIASDDACPECAALDGTTRDVNGEYDDPDAGDGPPLHPNCRCTEGVVA